MKIPRTPLEEVADKLCADLILVGPSIELCEKSLRKAVKMERERILRIIHHELAGNVHFFEKKKTIENAINNGYGKKTE